MSEVKNIPRHWQIKKLGDLCDKITKGGTPTTYGFSFVSKGINFIKIENIDEGKVNLSSIRNFITEETHNYQKKSILEANDLLFSIAGTIGKTCLIKKEYLPANTNQALAILRGYYKYIQPQFLTYQLDSSISQYVKSKARGGAMNNISLEDLKGIELVLPPLSEQQLIVSKVEELLSDLDNGKQQLLTAQQQLKVYRQSLLKWAFEGKLSLNRDSSDLYDKHDLELRSNKNHDNQANHKNQGSDSLPKGWKWVELGDVCSNVEYGSAIKSKTTGKVPVLRMGNIQKGRFDWDDLVFTDDDVEIKKYLLRKNDVLFNRTNSAEWVGKTAIYKGERPAIFAGYLIRINRIERLIDADYLTYYLNTHAAKQYGNSVRSFGVNQSNINGTKLKTYPIPLPSLEEQQQIVDELESKLTVCDKIEETITQSLLQAETLRQSILQKAFEGKLVSRNYDSDDEDEAHEIAITAESSVPYKKKS